MNWFRTFSPSRIATAHRRRRSNSTRHCGLKLEILEDRCLLTGGLDANQRFIQALYQDDLGRTGTSAEIDGWVPVLVSHGEQAVVNGIEHSIEARGRIARTIYGDQLGRPPLPYEVQAVVSAFQKGATWESVTAAVLGSDEFFNRAPSINGVGGGPPSNQTFISALHHQLLNRDPTPTESANYLSNALAQVGREGVSLMVLKSAEYRGDIIRQFYGNHPIIGVLHRTNPPSSVEVNAWVSTGRSLGDIHFIFETTAEKFGLGNNGLDANQRFIQTLYQDALGRAGSGLDLAFWEQVLLARGEAAVVVGINQSTEARTRLVKSWYANFLGRNAAPSEAQVFVGVQSAGISEEQTLTIILGSSEYYLHAPQVPGVGGGLLPNQAFVKALYLQLLNRTPSMAEITFWESQLALIGRGTLALQFMSSAEFRASAIRTFYASLLQRSGAPSQAEVDAWVNSGQGLWAVERAFESAYEMYAVRSRLAAMGDSITDVYAKYVGTNPLNGLPLWGNNGDQNWVEQLVAMRPASVMINNLGVAGATSVNLIAQGQPSTTAGLVFQGIVDNATLIIGMNDIVAYLMTVNSGGSPDATPFVNKLAMDVQMAVDTAQTGGKVRLVIGNVPDITKLPQIQAIIGANVNLANLVSNAVVAANKKIEDFASARGIPVVDLYSLLKLNPGPLTIGGAQVSGLLAPDGFHPGTVLQGLLANAIFEAEKIGYGCTVAGLKLSDQEILDTAKIPHVTAVTYFDVSGYVKVSKPYQSTMLPIFALA